jgi:exodeoxyribonuclease III
MKKGYSGTAIFTKVKPLKVDFNFGSKHIHEGRSITMEFKKFILVVAYVPNSKMKLVRLEYRV